MKPIPNAYHANMVPCRRYVRKCPQCGGFFPWVRSFDLLVNLCLNGSWPFPDNVTGGNYHVLHLLACPVPHDATHVPLNQVSWKLFLTSTAAPGNGGPLLIPKGQEGKLFYEVPPAPAAQSKASSNSAPAASSHKAEGEA